MGKEKQPNFTHAAVTRTDAKGKPISETEIHPINPERGGAKFGRKPERPDEKCIDGIIDLIDQMKVGTAPKEFEQPVHIDMSCIDPKIKGTMDYSCKVDKNATACSWNPKPGKINL
jgi:hypothetical protein